MKTKTMTYSDIAKETGLGKITGARFVAYMTMRWASNEDINCACGYAKEWAERFLNEQEYPCSDLAGLRTLQKIDCCENCHERLTSDELLEAVEGGLKLGEVCCDSCYLKWQQQSSEEKKHPDEDKFYRGF